MDIHKPKAVHSWREFASEIGVIIIGVLIALSAEQLVEWRHWRHEVQEGRETLASELGRDLGARKLRADQYGCIGRRVADLQLWLDSYKTDSPLTPTVPIGGPATVALNFEAWNVAQTGQIAAHMPIEERIRFATLYGNMRRYSDLQNIDHEVWADLQQFEGETRLEHEDRMKLRGIIARLSGANEGFKNNWPGILRRATEAGVKIIPFQQGGPPDTASSCGSLFAKRVGH